MLLYPISISKLFSGSPFIVFRSESYVNLSVENDEPSSGLFEITCPIFEGDTIDTVTKRLTRLDKIIKDHKQIELWRYEDPILGPRQLPTLENPLEGKIQMKSDSKFHIDLTAQKVYFDEEDLGEAIVYIIPDN